MNDYEEEYGERFDCSQGDEDYYIEQALNYK